MEGREGGKKEREGRWGRKWEGRKQGSKEGKKEGDGR
ncbi:Legumin B, partial [Ophiophagus hannah]